MSRPNVSFAAVNGNGTMNVPMALSEKSGNIGLSIDTQSPPYAGPLSKSPSTPDTPGLRSRDAYDSLPPWRAAIRNKLMESLDWQSTALANMQALVRTPWLDQYFVYTSSLGTHTFFHDGSAGVLFLWLRSIWAWAATCSGAGSLHFVVCKGCCLRPKAIRAPCHPSHHQQPSPRIWFPLDTLH
jgi:hypothetical protein